MLTIQRHDKMITVTAPVISCNRPRDVTEGQVPLLYNKVSADDLIAVSMALLSFNRMFYTPHFVSFLIVLVLWLLYNSLIKVWLGEVLSVWA